MTTTASTNADQTYWWTTVFIGEPPIAVNATVDTGKLSRACMGGGRKPCVRQQFWVAGAKRTHWLTSACLPPPPIPFPPPAPGSSLFVLACKGCSESCSLPGPTVSRSSPWGAAPRGAAPKGGAAPRAALEIPASRCCVQAPRPALHSRLPTHLAIACPLITLGQAHHCASAFSCRPLSCMMSLPRRRASQEIAAPPQVSQFTSRAARSRSPGPWGRHV